MLRHRDFVRIIKTIRYITNQYNMLNGLWRGKSTWEIFLPSFSQFLYFLFFWILHKDKNDQKYAPTRKIVMVDTVNNSCKIKLVWGLATNLRAFPHCVLYVLSTDPNLWRYGSRKLGPNSVFALRTSLISDPINRVCFITVQKVLRLLWIVFS